MRLPPFELHAPDTIEEATRLLDHHGDEAALYCGGTEILLLLKLRLAAYRHLVDVKAIHELRGIGVRDGRLSLGAATTHREIERSPVVREGWPALAEMERDVANLRVRAAGTLGGNLCFADPHSDPATFLLATDAVLVTRRGGGRPRRIPATAFVAGPYQTALEPGELLVSVELPAPAPATGTAHSRLRFHERPAATVACAARTESGRIAEARIAVGSVGPVPRRATEAESALLGAEAASPGGALETAAALAAEASGAVEDENGSVEYKRHLVGVLVRRTLLQALERAA